MFKNLLKAIMPPFLLKSLRPIYHGAAAFIASIYFGQPSKKMVVVGVTGTAGKSTTVQMLSKILNQSGKKTGFITTISFFDGNEEFLNKHGLSMPGGWLLQKQLKQMLRNGSGYAVVECTSEGLAQNRHIGVDFDMALFTNLSQAHIEAHGNFEIYKRAKQKLFAALKMKPAKKILPNKIIGVNLDDPYWEQFASFPVNRTFGITTNQEKHSTVQKIFVAQRVSTQKIGFYLQGIDFNIPLAGQFNLYNALLATAAANELGIKLEAASLALSNFDKIRGRMELVPNNLGFKIIVDYGCEPASFEAALKAAKNLPHKKLIHVFGSTGGHRDVTKRFFFGQTSAKFSDSIIVTNDDVYDSDPNAIAQDVELGIKNQELWKGEYEVILDRREAIAKALVLAKKDDLVLITGKGSEQFLVLAGNKRIEWDDVETVNEELKKISNS